MDSALEYKAMDVTRAYSTFVRTLEAGSFSAVAREMGISQSAVSKIIAALETNLGVQLFTRTTRKLHPTDEALKIYQHALQLLDTLETLTSYARRTPKADPSGVLRLTMPSSFGKRRLMPILPKFLERYPKVKLDIVMTDEVLDLIEEGLELGIRIGTLPSNTLIARSLGIVEHTVVAAPGYLDKFGRPESPLDLSDHNCIVYGSTNRWDFESENGRQSIDVSGCIRIDDADAIHDAVMSELGIAQIPNWIVDKDFKRAGMEQLLEDYYPIPRPVSIIYPQTRFLTQRARSFIDFVVSELRKS